MEAQWSLLLLLVMTLLQIMMMMKLRMISHPLLYDFLEQPPPAAGALPGHDGADSYV